MIAITLVSPSKGSPIGFRTDANGGTSGGQLISITGSGLDVVTSVLIDGRPGSIVSVAEGMVTLRAPTRATNGSIDWSGGAVDVVVSGPGDTVTLTGAYTYIRARIGAALQSMRDRIAVGSTATKFFFDYSADQVVVYKQDALANYAGQAWPVVMLFTTEGNEAEEERTAFGSVYHVEGIASTSFPITATDDIEELGDCLASDMIRAIMLDPSNSGITDWTTCPTWQRGPVESATRGAILTMFVHFKMQLRHIINDPTSDTEWRSTP